MSDKIAREVAEQEFDRFAESMDLDLKESGLDDDEVEDLHKLKNILVEAIQKGSMVINDDGEPVYTPVRGDEDYRKPITFHEPTGASLMAMDRKKKNEDIGKLYSAMGEITKLPAARFARMKMRDLKVCMAVTQLFLG